jgi:hypothetical protein
MVVAHTSPPERGIDLLADIVNDPSGGVEREPAVRRGTLAVMGLIYKPFGYVLALIGALVGRRLFDYVWTKLDDEEPPEATTLETSWAKVIGAAAAQGVIFKLTRVVIDRYGAIGWHYLTGFWPGEKRAPVHDD